MTVEAPVRGHHRAFHYGSDQELLDGAGAFLGAGLDPGELVVLACSDVKNRLLSGLLVGHPELQVLRQDEVYQRPATAVARYQRLLAEFGGCQSVRVFGEIPFPNGDWVEWGRYEAVLNRAFRSRPVSVCCGYDLRELPAEVVADSERTHPELCTLDSWRPSDNYLDPVDYLLRSGADTLDATSTSTSTATGEPDLLLTDVQDLAEARHAVRSALADGHCPEPVARDLVIALGEVTANAVRHGRGPVTVRLWSRPDRSVGTVTDGGPGFADPFAGYQLVDAREPLIGEAGLWLVRQLCDRVDVLREQPGFTIRLTLGH